LAAEIDTELFNEVADDAGFDPYAKNPDKETLGRLRNEVEAVIDQAQQVKKGPLTRTEKEELMYKVIDKKVKEKGILYDSEMPAAVVKKENWAKVYVPIAEVPEDWLKAAANYMRSVGAVPNDPSWTDAKIVTAYRGRLERAYALELVGAPGSEGRAALEGR